MRFLAFNTAGKSTQLALVDGNKNYVWYDGDGRRASEVLLAKTDELLFQAGLKLSDLDFLACVIGPGSFTGIRIGVSAVRAMCYALGLNAVCVTQSAMLAYNERAEDFESIVVLSDASNGNAYVAAYGLNREVLLAPACLTVNEALAFIASVDEPMALCVDEITADWIKSMSIPANAILPDRDCLSLIRAVKANAEQKCDYSKIEPLYIRVSQAEKDLLAKEKQQAEKRLQVLKNDNGERLS